MPIDLTVLPIPQTSEFTARAAISEETVFVVENLNGVKDAEIKAEYPAVFTDIIDLTLRRNVLNHHYEHAEKTVN